MAGVEIIVCIISAVVSCQVADRAKKEVHKKNEGTFSITVLGEKDIVIKPTKHATCSYDKLSEYQTNSSDSVGRTLPPETKNMEEVSQPMIPKKDQKKNKR